MHWTTNYYARCIVISDNIEKHSTSGLQPPTASMAYNSISERLSLTVSNSTNNG